MTLRNDATRLRIVTKDLRRPRAVVARQGQVLLDADFDQQARHQIERVEVETADTLGHKDRLVVPAGDTGFLVTAGATPESFEIGAGHGYLSGWLLENPAVCRLLTQPHPRDGDPVAAPSVIAVKALVRHIDPVEEPVLADAALADAQASGRALVDWQVFPFPLAAGGAISCATVSAQADWQALIAPSTGTLAVMLKAAAPATDPCSLTPGGGYTRLENLLYRVEVHDGQPVVGASVADGPRFGLNGLKLKLSRRNASVMVRIVQIAGAELSVAPPALDARNWFAPGLAAEIVCRDDDVDPREALDARRLFRVALATDERVVLDATAAEIAATKAVADDRWFLRLWDTFPTGPGLADVTASGGGPSDPVDLGDGISVTLGAGTFRRGDYWTWSARADGTIDWPAPGNIAEAMRPHGPEIRYAPIAVLSAPAASAFEDCRIPFATLTDRTLLYRGGDGQGVAAPLNSGMAALPAKLRVAVMRGETPVAGVPVRWSFVAPAGGACSINGAPCDGANTPEVLTDAAGLAEVTWEIDSANQAGPHQVQAQIAQGAAPGAPPVLFTAFFESARRTTYEPGACQHLVGVDNVQDALDTLCKKIGVGTEPRTMRLDSIRLAGAPGIQELIQDGLILNGLETAHDAFIRGISFQFDLGAPDNKIVEFDPLVEVELDLPYPTTDPDRLYWAQASAGRRLEGSFGFQRMRLDGTVKRDSSGAGGLTWMPSRQAIQFILAAPAHLFGQSFTPDYHPRLKDIGWRGDPKFPRVLCRIRLRSALIFKEDRDERIYLNAEHLGVAGPVTSRELLHKERDPQRAADLDIFIYLNLPRV